MHLGNTGESKKNVAGFITQRKSNHYACQVYLWTFLPSWEIFGKIKSCCWLSCSALRVKLLGFSLKNVSHCHYQVTDQVTWKINVFTLYYLPLSGTELKRKTNENLLDIYSNFTLGKLYSSCKLFDHKLFSVAISFTSKI